MTTQPFPSPYHLHPRAERAVKRGHPWVYAEGIRRLRHGGQPGDLAVMFDRRDRFLAIGLYDPASPIRIRVLPGVASEDR
jgi:23S rRNA (cytosine1962-C5)-methyltransferase